MIFYENRLLADDSHETSYLNFFRKLGKMSQNLSSTAVVIGVKNFMDTLTVALNNSHKIQLFIDQGDNGKRIQWTSGIDFTISVHQPSLLITSQTHLLFLLIIFHAASNQL